MTESHDQRMHSLDSQALPANEAGSALILPSGVGHAVGRRAFFRMALGAGVAAGLLLRSPLGHAFAEEPEPDGAAAAGDSPAQNAPVAFQAYHGVTGAQHQTRFNDLAAKGYRIISLSVYGDPADPRYAAVWVKRGGPAWAAVHGVNATGYQSAFDYWTGRGYRPLIVTAAGPRANAVFAAVFDKSASASWFARHDLPDGADSDPSSFQGQSRQAFLDGLILRAAAIYGDGSDRRYAGIWEANPVQTHWGVRARESSASYQTWFNGFTQIPSRPAYVTLSADQQYLAVFRDDAVGPWIARHGLTSSAYQTEFNTRVAQGYYPICVQGGGSGSDTRYAAVFAKQDAPSPRGWNVTGVPVPKLAAVDTLIKNFMQQNGIRAGTVAVARNGVMKYARAFTWAEPGYPVTQPSNLFRLASVSKAFTAAALQKAYDLNLLAPGMSVFPKLGITAKALASQTVDPRVNTITVQQLADHSGGWDDTGAGSGFDPVFGMRAIAQALGLAGGPTKWDIARYMYGEPLQFDPGARTQYSNFGYLLLGLLIEKVSGKPFIDFLKQKVLTPLGVSDVVVSKTRRDQKLANEVTYDQFALGPTPLNPTIEVLTPYPYGGEGFLTEVMDSGGGLAASATAVTKLIRTYLAWGVGYRSQTPGNWWLGRSGSMAGASSLAVSRGGDGVDYCYIFNTRQFNPTAGDVLGKLGTDLEAVFNSVSL